MMCVVALSKATNLKEGAIKEKEVIMEATNNDTGLKRDPLMKLKQFLIALVKATKKVGTVTEEDMSMEATSMGIGFDKDAKKKPKDGDYYLVDATKKKDGAIMEEEVTMEAINNDKGLNNNNNNNSLIIMLLHTIP